MSNYSFCIGDRVIATDVYGGKDLRGMTGTVIELHGERPSSAIGIEFDKYIGGHSCGCKGRNGYCWCVSPSIITLFPKSDYDLEFDTDDSLMLTLFLENFI